MPVYAWGSNGSGQLGIGHVDDVSLPARHISPPLVQSECPVAVAAGGNHTLVLYPSGTVTITPALESSITQQPFQPDIFQDKVKQCSATWEASALCTRSDQLITCGTGSRGELGHGNEHISTSGLLLDLSPIGLQELEIVQLASGVYHTVAVLSNGEVIGWGNGRKGQLGEPAEMVWRPRKITGLPFKVSKAVCGREFTYFVGDSHDGRHVVLGSDKWQVKSNAPEAVPGWKDIGASWGSIFVHFESGKVLSWGRNDHGQLAPPGLPDISKLAVGSEHAVALTLDGLVCAWGWGEHGNCGPNTDDAGDVKGKWNVIPLPDDMGGPVKGVGAGCATSWLWG